MNMKTAQINRRGQAAIEFALAIPAVALLVLAFVSISMMCIRGEVASAAAFEAARASALTRNLPDETMNGGDSPSPYCRCMEGYCLCGFGN